MLEKIKHWYRTLPDKKVYFELVGAVLTIPVLVTVILLNLNNLNNQNKNAKNDSKPSASPTSEKNKSYVPVTVEKQEATPSPNPSCKKDIGPIQIISPHDGQVISANPVCIEISYKQGEYCTVTWSVKVDNGQWSDFSDNNICLYDMTNGSKMAQVRVRNVDGTKEILLQRTFQYTGQAVVPSTIPATDSAH